MRHWSQLATRSWRARPTRTLGALAAIALGTGAVVWVMCCYESVRQATMWWARDYVGKSDLNIESPLGRYNQLPERMVEPLRDLDPVQHLTARLDIRLKGMVLPRQAVETDAAPRIRTDLTPEIDAHGIDLEHEFDVRTYDIVEGRMLRPDDGPVCLLEAPYARNEGLGVGDVVRLWSDLPDQPTDLEIVGLFQRRRVAQFQKPLAVTRLDTLQRATNKFGLVTSIDVVLKDDSRQGLREAAGRITPVVRRYVPNANITSAETRMEQIDKAQTQVQQVLGLLSSVSLLTALFIILSTLSMGMTERIAQLGLMRCVGVTRMQLAAIVFLEVLPLGAVGVVAGVPLGLGLTLLTVWLVPAYVGAFVVSWTGVWLAVVSGLATTLLAAMFPAVIALSVSPLEASRPRARKPSELLLLGVAAAALAVFVTQFFALTAVRRSPRFMELSTTAIVLLYVGFALLGPLAVRYVGSLMVYAAAALTRVKARLLQDQVGHAVWRSAGICCGLMVGLSLIVGLVVFNSSVTSAWAFPTAFPEAYVWSFDQMRKDRDDAAEIVSQIDGIAQFSTCNAINCIVEERPAWGESLYMSVTWFLGVDPDSFFDLFQLEFYDGDPAEAIAKLKQGDHVIIARDFAKARNKQVGDKVRVILGQRDHYFTVAGIVQSPAIDLAATYFQAQTEMRVAAVGSVIGSNDDMRKYFRSTGTKLVLLNFDLPPAPVPPDWPPPRDTTAGAVLPFRYYDESVPVEKRWIAYCQDRVLDEIRTRLDAPRAFGGTVRELKNAIDREINSMTTLLTAVPTVALIVAAIGVANLMTANVTSRIKQLAILRAVGATRGLVLRLVIGEALVLGLLGSGLGLALGLALARNTTVMTERMYGMEIPFETPWAMVAAATALTIGLCMIAGILPARHASRTNVVDALHTV